MWYRAILALLCALPLVLCWGTSTRSSANDNVPSSDGGRRRFLKTAAIGGVVVGAAVLQRRNILGPAPFVPAPHSLDDKVMVITGGTTGLGLESAKRLAAGGATVVLTSRTLEKGQKAVDAVNQYLAQEGITNKNVFAVLLDLDDLDSVRGFCKRLEKTPVGSTKIDVLMNNAGVMAIPQRELTKDGYERTFQSNHLGHFLLTARLFPKLASDATVINVSSEAYKFASKGLEIDNLNGQQSYGPWSSYGQSKLANVLFSKELQARADKVGRRLTAVSLHPGMVSTDLARNLIGEAKWQAMQTQGPSWQDALLRIALSLFVISVERGATTQVWLAAGQAGDDVGGEYFDKCQSQTLGSAATDMNMARQLWEASEKMTGETFDIFSQ